MAQSISVIICTYNPRRDYLDRVLKALDSQTLPKNEWELLLIDNASKEALSSFIDINWHPFSRHIREEKLGLTPARLRGIKESKAEIIVFVDDDNLLEAGYLENVLQISNSYPFLGAWGGQIKAEFDEPPAEWTKPYWSWLAIREFDKNKWLNVPGLNIYPCGAGMCVRRIVAEKYAAAVLTDWKRQELDRKGTSLSSCGDLDLAYTACDIDMGMGLFVSLKLQHLIPPGRLREEYLLKLAEGNAYSNVILNSLRDQNPLVTKTNWKAKLRESYRLWRMEPRSRRFYIAHQRGESLAIQELHKK